MNLHEMMINYQNDGLSREFASARVCQDIILKAIANGPLNRNVTIKGGVVMRSITNDNRRATRDIDLDFIHYSLSDDSIRTFISKMNCLPGINLEIDGDIEELKHQDYHGKCISVKITDDTGISIKSKIDIGVHKHFELEQDVYCFDVCMDENGASLLKNTVEQSFTEKLRSLLIFGSNSRRYKDIFDMYYLGGIADFQKLNKAIDLLIFSDSGMRENDYDEIIKRISNTFADKRYLERVSGSRQRWLDEPIENITVKIIDYLQQMKNEDLKSN